MTSDPLDHFIETFAVAKEGEGFPRIAGRIMALFLLHGGPFSFSEIAERLQVSRASVSNNLRLVKDRGIIERIGQPGDRQDYYQLAGDPFRSTLEQSLRDLEGLLDLARVTSQASGGIAPDARQRLLEMVRVYSTALAHVGALRDALYGAPGAAAATKSAAEVRATRDT